MPLDAARPVRFRPMGAADPGTTPPAFVQESLTFPGAMASLQNLIPDPATSNSFICRPGAIQLPNFTSGFFQLSGISCFYIYGDYVFGLAQTNLNPGFEQPFCYNLLTQALVTVTGFGPTNTPSNANLNLSQAWVPPIMALVGTLLIVTHPGYPNGANKIGWFDISTPTAPVWHAGDLTTQPFGAGIVPSAVANFNGRAYYLCNPTNAQPVMIFSDVLLGTTRTNANQSITFDDNEPLTALAPLQLQNQLGGVIQSLIVFKGLNAIYQITGDYALTSNPLTKNLLGVSIGTLSPLALMNIEEGLLFLDHDGFRLIDYYGKISQPIGSEGKGICQPFTQSILLQPTRVVGASNGKIVRATANFTGPGLSEYWFDLSRKAWTGPHTTQPLLMQPYKNTFIMTTAGGNGLFQTDHIQYSTSTFMEFGNTMNSIFQTALIPSPEDDMDEYQLNEAYFLTSNPSGMQCIVYNNYGHNVDAVNMPLSGTGSSSFGYPCNMAPTLIPFTKVHVFTGASFYFDFASAFGYELSDVWLRLQKTGHMKGALSSITY